MKKLFLLTVLAGAMPLMSMAQDDLYFTPSDEKESSVEEVSSDDKPAYYSGISKSEDEYNRRGKLSSYYQKVGEDSLGNDIIEFRSADGTAGGTVQRDTIYPGSEKYVADNDDDFKYSRRMGQFDDFYAWYNPAYYGYWYDPYNYWYGWNSPWYYSNYYWGWGGYPGFWYDPWYYPYWSLYYPAPYFKYNGLTGTGNHSGGSFNKGSFGGTRYGTFAGGRRGGNVGSFGSRPASTVQNGNRTFKTNRSGARFGGSRTFGGNRTYQSRSYTPQRSQMGGNRSFGSFGGSRGGGFSGGFSGGHSGSFGGGHAGGGHFGGGRR